MVETSTLLSTRERDILWLASQGHNSEYIARDHHLDAGSVKNIYARIASRLGTCNLVHSVAFGLTTGIIGTYRDCGSRRAYLRHLRRPEETPCVACRQANAAYVSAQNTAPLPEDVGLTPTQLRLMRVLDSKDCSLSEAADILGMDRKRAASHMTQVYRRLGVVHLYRYDRRRAALARARDKGYLDSPGGPETD
jgi:DNA-binding CsgD family transcriptional regulator